MEYLFEVGAPIGEEAAPAILARRGIPSLAFDLDVRGDALVLDLVPDSADRRIVTVSSLAHDHGTIDWDDLNRERSYRRCGSSTTPCPDP